MPGVAPGVDTIPTREFNPIPGRMEGALVEVIDGTTFGAVNLVSVLGSNGEMLGIRRIAPMAK